MTWPELSHGRRRPIVFGGPSLSQVSKERLSQFDVRPPVRRGDLDALRGGEPGTLLMLDGLFGASLAVTPLECRQLLTAGWTLTGAASMGALRASELWNAGMHGVGTVYHLLRRGIISCDADVAVAYHPDTWVELGASMVHVRAIVAHLERRIDLGLTAPRLIAAARTVHWLERTWARVFREWRELGLSEEGLLTARRLSEDSRLNPKRRDALEAVRLLDVEDWVHPMEEDQVWDSARS